MSLAHTALAEPNLINVKMELPDRILETRNQCFREQFNRSSFQFSHNLAAHPLFEIPRLVELANSLLNKDKTKVAFYSADLPLTAGWKHKAPRKAMSVEEAIACIEESGSWVLLKSVQEVPPYRAVLEQCLRELEELTGAPLQKEITWVDAYIFIASPRSVTPYHIDHESNFLLQIHGEKDINLFDPNDRSVLTDEEIEYYYIGHLSGAKYREENQSKASVYHLTPGTGVHHPARAPHWVKNGDGFSVSLSINFCMRQYDLQARVYQANHYLRKLGIRPTPPGLSPLRDGLKIRALGSIPRIRKPKTKYELLRYGIAPALVGRWAMKYLKRRFA